MLRKCLRVANNEQYSFTINPTTLSDMTWTRNSTSQIFLLAIRRRNKIAKLSIGDVKENFSPFFHNVMMNASVFNRI